MQQGERATRQRGAGDKRLAAEEGKRLADERVKVLEAFCASQNLTAPAPVVQPAPPADDPKVLKALLGHSKYLRTVKCCSCFQWLQRFAGRTDLLVQGFDFRKDVEGFR